MGFIFRWIFARPSVSRQRWSRGLFTSSLSDTRDTRIEPRYIFSCKRKRRYSTTTLAHISLYFLGVLKFWVFVVFLISSRVSKKSRVVRFRRFLFRYRARTDSYVFPACLSLVTSFTAKWPFCRDRSCARERISCVGIRYYLSELTLQTRRNFVPYLTVLTVNVTARHKWVTIIPRDNFPWWLTRDGNDIRLEVFSLPALVRLVEEECCGENSNADIRLT